MSTKVKFNDFIKDIDWVKKDRLYWKALFCQVFDSYDKRYALEEHFYSVWRTNSNTWPFKAVNYVRQHEVDETLNFVEQEDGTSVAKKQGSEKQGYKTLRYVKVKHRTGAIVYEIVESYVNNFADVLKRLRYQQRGNKPQVEYVAKVKKVEECGVA